MTDPVPDLDRLLADVRQEAAILERNGATFSVARVRELVDAVADATEEYRVFLPETLAAIRCGYSAEWLKGRFETMKADGHARQEGRVRYYRACAIPRRAMTSDTAERARQAARDFRRARRTA